MLGEHLFYKEITMASAHIEHKLSLLPDLPGSYQMKDINGKIIYVGKAKTWKIGCGLISRVHTTVKLRRWCHR